MDAAGEAELCGRVIAGKYQVDSFLGGGAMGAVYKARQTALDKVVAIKVMHKEYAKDAQFAARFQREAKAASRLDHPNAMRVFDFGVEPDGLMYIAMELLDGRDLFKVIQEDWPLSEERIVNLLAQALAALAVAHDMGVVHRDLKPENIMVLRGTDDEGRPADVIKVCDFGIAKIVDARSDEDAKVSTKLTAQGIVIGTPEYMSPEQGRGEPLDLRSDLYSMGVILYQLLTGRVPFDAESAIGVVLKHVTDAPQPPREIHPGVNLGLEEVCLRALAKRREARFQGAREMRAALRDALGIGAPPRSAPGVGAPPRSAPLLDPGLGTAPTAAALVAPIVGDGAVAGARAAAPHAVGAAPVPVAVATARVPVGIVTAAASVASATAPVPAASATGPVPAASATAPVPEAGAPAPALVAIATAPTVLAKDAPPGTGAGLTADAARAPRSRAPVVAGVALASICAALAIVAPRLLAKSDVPPAPTATSDVPPRAEPRAEASRAEPAPATPVKGPEVVARDPPASAAHGARPTAAAPHGREVRAHPAAGAPTGAPAVEPPSAAPVASAAPSMAEPVAAPVVPLPAPPPSVVVAATPPAPAPAAFDPSQAQVAIARATATSGLSVSKLRAALARVHPAWTHCYRTTLRAHGAAAAGEASLRLAIDDTGRVTSATLSGASFLPPVAACIEAPTRGLRLPDVDTGDATADIALSFRVP